MRESQMREPTMRELPQPELPQPELPQPKTREPAYPICTRSYLSLGRLRRDDAKPPNSTAAAMVESSGRGPPASGRFPSAGRCWGAPATGRAGGAECITSCPACELASTRYRACEKAKALRFALVLGFIEAAMGCANCAGIDCAVVARTVVGNQIRANTVSRTAILDLGFIVVLLSRFEHN